MKNINIKIRGEKVKTQTTVRHTEQARREPTAFDDGLPIGWGWHAEEEIGKNLFLLLLLLNVMHKRALVVFEWVEN